VPHPGPRHLRNCPHRTAGVAARFWPPTSEAEIQSALARQLHQPEKPSDPQIGLSDVFFTGKILRASFTNRAAVFKDIDAIGDP